MSTNPTSNPDLGAIGSLTSYETEQDNKIT